MKNQMRIIAISLLVVVLNIIALPSLATEDHFCITDLINDDSETRNWSNPTTGHVNGITVVVLFPDLDIGEYPIDLDDFEAFLNQDGYSEHGNNGSVQNYYEDVSYGLLNFTNTLYPIAYPSELPRSWYDVNGGVSRTRTLVRLIIDWLDADPDFDFRDYDSNEDGVLDSLHIVAQGIRYSLGVPFSGMHPHWTRLYGTDIIVDGIDVEHYAISNYGHIFDEDQNPPFEEHHYPTLGVYCHEQGHMLAGWKDYATVVGNNSDQRGHLDRYCLMGLGGNDSLLSGDLVRTNPSHPNAYLKKQAGWVTPTVLADGGLYHANHETGGAGIIPHPTEGNRDCYIVENRQASGRDSILRDSGIAIFRVHFPYSGNDIPNIELVQADNTYDQGEIPNGGGNLFRAPDYTFFDFRSLPFPTWEDGAVCNFSLSAISQPENDMTYNFVLFDMVEVTLTPDPPEVPLHWTVTGPEGLYQSSGVGATVLSLGKTGVFTVTFSNPYYAPPNPETVEVDLSAVQGNSLILSTQFDSPVIVEASGDLGDPASATTVCTVDFNNDDKEDLFIGNFDGNNLLLLADGSGGFLENSAPDILALAHGVKHAAWGDIDNDGDADVFLVRGDGNHMLLENSSNTLVDITPTSGLPIQGEISSVAWVDLDRNGNLDCFIVHANSDNELYDGNGTGGFVLGDAGAAGGSGISDTDYSQWVDYWKDGWSSVLVCSETSPNKLFRNNLGGLEDPGDVFYEATWHFDPSVAVAWGDYDIDGDMDLIRLSRAAGILELWTQDFSSHTFSKTVIHTIPNAAEVTSINLVDFNNDGYPDVYMTVFNDYDLLFLNDPHYQDLFIPIPLNHLSETAGPSVASSTIDANGDGAMDLYVVCDGGPNYLLYNNFYEPGNWMEFDLTSTSQNAGAIGAHVGLYNNQDSVFKEVAYSGSQGQNSSIIHFGLAEVSPWSVAIVNWGPGSDPTILGYPTINQVHRITDIAISEVAEYPVVSGGTNNAFFAVQIEDNGSTSVSAQADLSPLGGPIDMALNDGGIGPDVFPDDGIYTSPLFSSSNVSGQYSVVVKASVTHGGEVTQNVSVEVVEPGMLLVDGSNETDDLNQLSGEPYAGIYFDTPVAGSSENVMMITKDSGDDPEIFSQFGISSGGSPEMIGKNGAWFSIGSIPEVGSRGTFAADFDNDGDEDFFICNNNQGTRLYENTGTGFADSTSHYFAGNEVFLEGAHVAAWGDYNQDGKLDLFVATMDYTGNIKDLTPALASNPQWYLFKNTGDSFELTYLELIATPGLTLCASWNDVNDDGLLDLVVGELEGRTAGSPTVILNEGYKKNVGHYRLSEDPTTATISDLKVNSLDWFDYNHDNFPDLIVTEFGPNAGARILPNTGNGFAEPVVLSAEDLWTGAVIADYNLDGQEDVVLLPFDGLPALFIGDPGYNSQSFTELAYPLGMSEGATSGGFAADFNNDKDPDLYLGRVNTDEFLYKNERVDGPGGPEVGVQNWVRFNLETLGNCNASLIGTRVTVESGSQQWTQTVDGGSGRGGQRTNDLHFGLGNITGTVDITVDWPVSSPTTFTGLAVNAVHTLSDDAVPTINTASVSFSPEPFPGGADWVFTWTTTERGTEELDEVDLDFGSYFPGDYCWFMANTTLSWGDPDVEISIFPLVSGGWGHQVIWRNKPCMGAQICNYQFKVRSSVGVETPEEGSWVSFGEFDVCIKKDPFSN